MKSLKPCISYMDNYIVVLDLSKKNLKTLKLLIPTNLFCHFHITSRSSTK